MISEEQRGQIRRLFYAEHWRVGTIATQLGLHPDTVARAIGTERFNGTSKRASRQSLVDPYLDFIKETLEQYPTLTGTRIHEMLVDRGFTGSVVQLRRRIRDLDLRPKPKAEAFFKLKTLPGEQGQVDWGYYGPVRVGNTERKLWFFVMVLSWSRAHHVVFSFEQNAAAVARAHVACFEALGGVPRTILYDNMKTVVLDRVGDAICFHPRFLELASHYLFSAYPCNPRRGNEKGRVESRIKDLRQSFFAGRRFANRKDMREQWEAWRDKVAYQRRCPAEPTITVSEALENERPRLLPLPEHRFETDDVRATTVPKQPYVRYDANQYSVPHSLVGEAVTLAVNDTTVRVLHKQQEVARHRRSWARDDVVEDQAHLDGLAASKARARPLLGRQRLLVELPEAEPLFQALALRQEPLGPQTVALKQLLSRYDRDQVANAIAVALERGTPRAASVAHLLEQEERAQRRTPAAPIRVSERDDIQNLSISHHDLADYDDYSR